MVHIVHTVAVAAATLASGARKRRQFGSACERNGDCAVNAHCQNDAYVEWCRTNGAAGHCPAPYCIAGGGGPSPTPPPPTPPSPTPPPPTPPSPPPSPPPGGKD